MYVSSRIYVCTHVTKCSKQSIARTRKTIFAELRLFHTLKPIIKFFAEYFVMIYAFFGNRERREISTRPVELPVLF